MSKVLLTGTLFDAPAYRTYGAILVDERFRSAGFAAPLGFKTCGWPERRRKNP